jgi:hypothetical protein
MKKTIISLVAILLALCISGGGFVAADPLIPAHNETMGLQIGTVASVDGQLKEDNEVVWETTTGVLDENLTPPMPMIGEFDGIYWLIHDNPVFDLLLGKSNGEVQYTTTYTEDTAANQGHIGYTNQFSLDNANKAPGESNIESTRTILFTSDPVMSGTLSSNELLILDGAGQFSYADDKLICPFGVEGSDFIPGFCNYVETGSDVLISSGSLATNAKERFVSKSSDYPATMDYLIQLSGVNGPAEGSVAAHINAITKEGAVDVLYKIPYPDGMGTTYFVKSDLVSEVKLDDHTSVTGQIDLFEKKMHYESGVSL